MGTTGLIFGTVSMVVGMVLVIVGVVGDLVNTTARLYEVWLPLTTGILCILLGTWLIR